jgi:hypothetical protein
MVFTEQAKVHIDLGHADLYIWFIIKTHAYERPAGTDPRAADAVFPAVILIKGQYGSQDTSKTVLSCISTDYTVWTRSDTVATASAETLEDQFIQRPGWP